MTTNEVIGLVLAVLASLLCLGGAACARHGCRRACVGTACTPRGWWDHEMLTGDAFLISDARHRVHRLAGTGRRVHGRGEGAEEWNGSWNPCVGRPSVRTARECTGVQQEAAPSSRQLLCRKRDLLRRRGLGVARPLNLFPPRSRLRPDLRRCGASRTHCAWPGRSCTAAPASFTRTTRAAWKVMHWSTAHAGAGPLPGGWGRRALIWPDP